MTKARIKMAGVIECHPNQANAVADKVTAFFTELDQHIASVDGSIEVKHAKPEAQSAGGQPAKRKSKRATADGG